MTCIQKRPQPEQNRQKQLFLTVLLIPNNGLLI